MTRRVDPMARSHRRMTTTGLRCGNGSWQPSRHGFSPAPHPTLPHKGGGLFWLTPPLWGELRAADPRSAGLAGLFWLPPPLWGRAGVGGLALADDVPRRIATPTGPWGRVLVVAAVLIAIAAGRGLAQA